VAVEVSIVFVLIPVDNVEIAAKLLGFRAKPLDLAELRVTWLYPPAQGRPTRIYVACGDFRVTQAHDIFGSLESKTRTDRIFKGANPKLVTDSICARDLPNSI
jgi:hypothetical protein